MPTMFLISGGDASAGSMMGEMREMMDISEDRADLIGVPSGGAGQFIHSYGNSHLNARGYQKTADIIGQSLPKPVEGE